MLVKQNGNAIVLALVVVAVVSGLSYVVATELDRSRTHTLRLTEQLDLLALSETLNSVYSDANLCACNFDPTKNVSAAGALRFDSTNPTAEIRPGALFLDCTSGAPQNPLVQDGAPIASSQSAMTVERIAISNIQASGSGYTADLTVRARSAHGMLSRQPAKAQIRFQANVASPTQAAITSCSIAGAGGLGGGGLAGGSCSSSDLPGAIAYQQVVTKASGETYVDIAEDQTGGLCTSNSYAHTIYLCLDGRWIFLSAECATPAIIDTYRGGP